MKIKKIGLAINVKTDRKTTGFRPVLLFLTFRRLG